MIMSIIGFENKIEFKENVVNVIEIYNQKLFASIINIINNQCKGEEPDNQIVLMENEKRINMDKEMYLLTDVFNIDFNDKKIINKIYNILVQNIKNRQDYELDNMALKIRNYLIEEINELPFEFNMDSEIDILDLLKVFKVKIDTTSYTTVVEKIEFIINIISTLSLAEILVIPNLKTYLAEEELLEIYKYSIYNNIKLLILENKCSEKLLKYEQKNIIDENFDEF